jgi:hypothetical protein
LTIALEFGDGKVLMSNLEAVSSLTWEQFKTHFGEEKLKEMFTGVDILGLGYWSLTADFDGIFQGFMDQYETLTPPRRMFFDFADIKKKSSESFIKSLELIKSYNNKIRMTFSLNEHEVFELCSRVGVERPELTPAAIASALTIVREKIGFDELVVHTPEFAAASNASEGEAYAIQDRQSNVIRLAGAGDSFNGGFLCASLGDLPLKERLVVANAVTAFFVTQATAPNKEQLLAQIEKAADRCKTFIAVDLGAGSGRVIAATTDFSKIELEEIHRFDNPGTDLPGGSFWNIIGLYREILEGLRRRSSAMAIRSFPSASTPGAATTD